MEDLAIKPKALTKEGIAYLKAKVEDYCIEHETKDIEDVLPLMIMYVFNEGFKEGIVEAVKILRER